MTFTVIPNGIRIVHIGNVGTAQIVNTFGCENGGGATAGASLSDLAKSHGDAWRAHIVPILNFTYGHSQTLAYSLEDQSLAPGDAGYSDRITGGASGGTAATSNCVCVALKTAKRGRTYQGRSYLSPFPASAVNTDGQHWTDSLIATVQNAFAAYKEAVDPTIDNNGRLAICSKGSPSKGIQPHVEAVSGFLVRSAITTQRRRLT